MSSNPASRRLPSNAGRVTYTAGETAASVHLIEITRDGCRLPHADPLREGQGIEIEFLDGVQVAGTVESVEGDEMAVAFARPASSALVEYFAPSVTRGDASRAAGDAEDERALRDGFGRSLPPLTRDFRDL